jgi:hypothetical protein
VLFWSKELSNMILTPQPFILLKEIIVSKILAVNFFFFAPWAYYTVFSGVSRTLHPAV